MRKTRTFHKQSETNSKNQRAAPKESEAVIGELKRVEEAQKELLMKIERAKQEWEYTVDLLPELICLLDNRGFIIRANRTVETWKLGKVIAVNGLGFHELLHPHCTISSCYLNSFWKQAWDEINRGQPTQCETYDGILKRHIMIRIQPRKDYGKKMTTGSIVAIVQDITHRKKAEENQERLKQAIAAEKTRMEVMVDSMVDGVIMIGKKKEILLINPAAKKALHLDSFKDTDINFNIISKLLGYDPAALLKEEGKNSIKIEVFIYDIYYQAQVSSVLGRKGEILGIVVALRDISKEKEVDRMKSEFVSIASHELRTPLTSIKNAVSIILDETAGEINKNQKKFLSMADRNINRLTGIINELLDLSKIESKSMKISLNSLDLLNPLDTAIASVAEKSSKKSISIHKEIPSGLPQIYGDQDKLVQIFINLIDNAIKFTPEGGRINISVKDSEPDRDFIEISVADTGIGIPPDGIEKIFEKFYQVEGSLIKESEGTGLGLSIVRGLVEAQGGNIWAESKEGRGSRFMFTLPIYNTQRVLIDQLNREIAEAKEKYDLSLIIMELEQCDYFPGSYGKSKVILLTKKIKEVIQDVVRKNTDLVETQACDWLSVILTYTNKEKAIALCRRLQKVIAGQTFVVDGQSIKVNMVSGVAGCPEDGVTGEELIKNARSELMYEKKLLQGTNL
ncbi:MAG: ATP-binding protein [Thermodesulfobacteriota bacterium]|nr:ATP-binding protein [Thermodesulfobacteriota bacterium]